MDSSSRILLIREVATLLRVAPVTISRYLAKRRAGHGNFPLPISPPRSKLRWRESDILSYLESQSSATPYNITLPNVDPAQRTLAVKDFQKRQQWAAETLQKHRVSRMKQRGD